MLHLCVEFALCYSSHLMTGKYRACEHAGETPDSQDMNTAQIKEKYATYFSVCVHVHERQVSNCKDPTICFFPQIYKPNTLGHTIVSACNFPTEMISKYLDRVLALLMVSLPSYIQDTIHALRVVPKTSEKE